jgi:hypothetical protein
MRRLDATLAELPQAGAAWGTGGPVLVLVGEALGFAPTRAARVMEMAWSARGTVAQPRTLC